MTTPVDRITLKVAALELNIHHRTLAQMIREGKGPGVCVGTTMWITRVWLDRFKAGEIGPWCAGIGTMAVSVTTPPPVLRIRRRTDLRAVS